MYIIPIAVILLFIIGAAFGSFASVVIYRLHSKKQGIIKGKSACPQCDTKLALLDLVPILSYLTLRGKCRYCSKEISYMYPLIELLMGIVFAALFFKFTFVDAQLNFSPAILGIYLLYAFYSFILIATFFFDLHYMKVSDELLLPAILIGLIATLGAPATPSLIDALIGGAGAVVFFGLQALLSKGAWIGLGDLRIGAFMGIILGWKLVIVALFLSYLIGSVVSLIIAARAGRFFGVKIPFAPFLVTGTLITIFFGQNIMQWYLQALGY